MTTAALRNDRRRPGAVAPLGRRRAEASGPIRIARGRLVRRSRLLAMLSAPDAPPLIAVVAPAGYGKTLLLQEWCERDSRQTAWLTLGERDNDPDRLADALELAFSRASGRPFILVLDDLQALHEPAVLDEVATAAAALPPGATLALASRTEPALPLARRRAEGSLLEVRAPELAMTRSEAASLLRLAGLQLGREDLTQLLRRTEGWPAALSLATFSIAAHGGPRAAAGFSGADRHVSAYVREEILLRLAPAQRDLLLAASVLDTVSGPVCDALAQTSGSARKLTELARGNVPLVALDRSGEQWRLQRLFAETLRAELRRLEPELEPVLHRRASAWFANEGDVDRAIGHAIEAGDTRTAAELVGRSAATAIVHGHAAFPERWLGWFSESEIRADGALALTAVACRLAGGRGDLAAHWAAVAGDGAGTAADAAGLALAGAAVAREDLASMAGAVEEAYALAGPESPVRAACSLLAGVAARLVGKPEEAGRWLEEAARRAAVPAPGLHALALAELALLALERDDWEQAAALTSRARAQVDRFALDRQAPTALVYAVSALVKLHRGRVDDAQADRHAAARLGVLIVDFPAWYEVELDVLLARVALGLGDVHEARDRLRRAERTVDRLPEAVAMREQLGATNARLEALGQPDALAAHALTTAELRILRELPTHFSFREIAERTYVSANTVKTQANSVYRKLDVSCRSEAVARARALGLLGD